MKQPDGCCCGKRDDALYTFVSLSSSFKSLHRSCSSTKYYPKLRTMVPPFRILVVRHTMWKGKVGLRDRNRRDASSM